MRKFIFIIGILMIFMGMKTMWTSNNEKSALASKREVEVYFTDADMLRLLPATLYISSDLTTEKAAKLVIDELIKGRENNSKILRTIPNVKNGLNVKIVNDTAYVNMSKKFVKLHSDSHMHEVLTVYSIVNSLTSINEIKKVKFTIDGKIQPDFKGSIDMRETFVPDYTV